jgi:hypothetical protein
VKITFQSEFGHQSGKPVHGFVFHLVIALGGQPISQHFHTRSTQTVIFAEIEKVSYNNLELVLIFPLQLFFMDFYPCFRPASEA